ncbi:MAG TPA: hypothetical protein VFZ70_16745 [Euzebyales bacterium]
MDGRARSSWPGGDHDGGAPRRRRGDAVIAAATAAALIIAVGVAVANGSTALAWRDRALTAEQSAARAVAAANVSRQNEQDARRQQRIDRGLRRAIASQLAASEADAAALEARVIALAGDRARDEDVGRAAGTTAPVDRVRTLQAQVDNCVAQVDAARVAVAADAEADDWQAALTAAQATCEQVAADVDALADGAR